jgi:protein TonB
MMVGISPDVWAVWLRQPIVRGLLLSAGLHFAFIFLFQAAPFANGRQVVVINARLLPATDQATVKAAAVEEETVAQVDGTPEIPPSSMLTAMTPSVAMPVAQPAAPVSETRPEPAPVSLPVSPAAVEPPPPPPAEPVAGPPQETRLPSLPVGIDTHWYLARQVDIHPKAIGSIDPAYPEEAKQRNIEGTLKLMLKIDDLGQVQSVEVVEATPPGVFDDAAIAAFRAARFQPALKDGRPVRYQAYMRVDFKLKD